MIKKLEDCPCQGENLNFFLQLLSCFPLEGNSSPKKKTFLIPCLPSSHARERQTELDAAVGCLLVFKLIPKAYQDQKADNNEKKN
jgi:hypothetical protein